MHGTHRPPAVVVTGPIAILIVSIIGQPRTDDHWTMWRNVATQATEARGTRL